MTAHLSRTAARPKVASPGKLVLGGSPDTPIPVRRIPRRARHYLRRLDHEVWLEGEIQDLRWNREGDFRFSILDGGTRLECVIWRGPASRLSEESRRIVARQLVAVLGRLSLDGARVALRFVATDVRAAGVSAAETERERARAALERDGLLSASRKRPLPKVPRAIALVTSAGSAAEADVRAASEARFPGLHITVVPTPVQGADAPRFIVAALARAATPARCDVVLLCRGGGSRGDLAPFDDERVARAIAGCPVPVVTGIGHETDVTLADLVADVRALTPTAAAVVAVPDRAGLESELERLRAALERSLNSRVARDCERVGRAGAGLGHAVELRTAGARRHVDRLAIELHDVIPSRIARERQTCDRLEAMLAAELTRRVREAEARRDLVAAQLAALAPTAILGRGYAIPRARTGEVLDAVAAFDVGRPFVLTVRDGDVVAQVLSASGGATEFHSHNQTEV